MSDKFGGAFIALPNLASCEVCLRGAELTGADGVGVDLPCVIAPNKLLRCC